VSVTGQKNYTFTYDAAGAVTGENLRQYIYDQNQRLIKAAEAGAVLGEYLYNWRGQRLRKTTSSATVYFLYDRWGNLIEEAGHDGTFLRDYIYLGSLPVGRVDLEEAPLDSQPPETLAEVGNPEYQGQAGLYVSPATMITLTATDDTQVASTYYRGLRAVAALHRTFQPHGAA